MEEQNPQFESLALEIVTDLALIIVASGGFSFNFNYMKGKVHLANEFNRLKQSMITKELNIDAKIFSKYLSDNSNRLFEEAYKRLEHIIDESIEQAFDKSFAEEWK